MFQTCQARVSNKSALQECFRALRESVLPECATRVSARVSHKSVPQECPARVCHKSVTKKVSHTIVWEKCQASVFCKSGFSLFCRNPSSTWAFEKCIRVRGFYQVLFFVTNNMFGLLTQNTICLQNNTCVWNTSILGTLALFNWPVLVGLIYIFWFVLPLRQVLFEEILQKMHNGAPHLLTGCMGV